MIRMVLAAAAALALAAAAPAGACPSCHDCPMHAAAEQAGGERGAKQDATGDAAKGTACACAGEEKARCGERCDGCECPAGGGAKAPEGRGGEKT